MALGFPDGAKQTYEANKTKTHARSLQISFPQFRTSRAAKRLATPNRTPFRPFGREQPYLGNFLTMVINHLLVGWSSKY